MGEVILVGGIFDGDIIQVPIDKYVVVMTHNPNKEWYKHHCEVMDTIDVYYKHKKTAGNIRLFYHFK